MDNLEIICGILHINSEILDFCKNQTLKSAILESVELLENKDYEGIKSIIDEAMKAGLELCKLEGIIPAIESSHALAIFEQKKFKPNDIVVLSLSGRGDKDLDTYINHFKL